MTKNKKKPADLFFDKIGQKTRFLVILCRFFGPPKKRGKKLEKQRFFSP